MDQIQDADLHSPGRALSITRDSPPSEVREALQAIHGHRPSACQKVGVELP